MKKFILQLLNKFAKLVSIRQARVAAEKRYAKLQTEAQQTQQYCQTLQINLHKMQRLIALGLTQATMEKILSLQPSLYSNVASSDARRLKSSVRQLSTTLPSWLQQGLFDNPLSAHLHTEHPEHLFMVDCGTNDSLTLHVFLVRIGKALEQANSTGQVVICGKISDEIITYCRQHQLSTLEHAEIPALLTWATNQKLEKQRISYVWLCDVHAMLPLDAIQRATEVFVDCPSAALVVPLQAQTNNNICAAYALLDQQGALHHFPRGMPADHPYHGYRRAVDAVSSTLVVIKTQHLDTLDLVALGIYNRPRYQITELLWQFKAQQLEAIYESALCYQDENPYHPFETPEYEADRQLFFKRWQTQLLAQPVLSGNSLMNPKHLPMVLVIDATLLTYDEDSGSLRMFTLIKILGEMGYKVTFFPDNQDNQFKYRHALEALGVEVFHRPYTLGDALCYRQFTFAIVCRPEIGHRYISFLRLVSPDTKIFYDTVDIHYIREQRQAKIENNPTLAEQAQATKRQELSNCILADRVIIVTEKDGHYLQQELPHLKISVIPNIHQRQPLPETGFEQRDGLVFIGNYNHIPNEDAVYFFIEQVLPKIHARLPEVCFYVIGSNMTDRIKTLGNNRVKIIGWVDKVEPEFAKRRVFVSSLRYGAGMKGKIGQALSLGLPVVTTTIGAEGMGLVEEETALIANEPEKFAEAVCRLYSDAALWEKLSRQGPDYIKQHYSETAVREKLSKLLEETMTESDSTSEVWDYEHEYRAVKEQLDIMERSHSWRVTAPLRALRRRLIKA